MKNKYIAFATYLGEIAENLTKYRAVYLISL
jgi:hypothetical protein